MRGRSQAKRGGAYALCEIHARCSAGVVFDQLQGGVTIAENPRNYPETIRSAQRIDGLISSTNHGFAIRARTDGGTKGCVFEKTSDWACVSTFPPGAPPVASQSPTAAKAPQIAVDGHPGNELDFKSAGFTLNAFVSIRVADQSLRSVRRDAKASGSGDASATLNGLCQSQGWLFISATDGRAAPLSVDKTGFLWSNTGKVLCT
jgi:hypothetical protein